MTVSKRFTLSDIQKMPELYNTINEGESGKNIYAHVLYQNLMEQIADFEENLGDDEEVGAYLPSFGKEILFNIQSVGYHNPYFIIFYGTLMDNGRRAQLVQHISQVNILFVALKIKEKNRKPERIGIRNIESGKYNENSGSGTKNL